MGNGAAMIPGCGAVSSHPSNAQICSLPATSQWWQEGQHCAVALPAPCSCRGCPCPPGYRGHISSQCKHQEKRTSRVHHHPACRVTPAGLEMRLLQVSVPIPATIQSGNCFSACSRSQAAVSSPVMHRLHQCIICPLNKICMLLRFQEALRTESTHASLSGTN